MARGPGLAQHLVPRSTAMTVGSVLSVFVWFPAQVLDMPWPLQCAFSQAGDPQWSTRHQVQTEQFLLNSGRSVHP